MAHGGKERRFRLVGLFCFGARLPVFQHQRMKLRRLRSHLFRQILTMAVQFAHVGAKRFHQTANGIQFADASRLRKRRVNIALQ
ncbi:Uncharacterised protein [Salmonella enterica subsp. enterica serovar Bovismorbificans]|uniref:Uncharacterized protein n=1 Tax=Salmonella enterica subsp. enterica serovar Bovismorbificans TaxID=58097 RepID=A0A655CRH5_SALET|nr:Uncharacterised protein [Salmonella enterica subsp. enterica serovar Bovismorbificans]CNU89921.1 Uncharacterised protein [Salmonella enterica subsp. enterica serovar Bovismorbificans]